jgi:hypothetical protein
VVDPMTFVHFRRFEEVCEDGVSSGYDDIFHCGENKQCYSFIGGFEAPKQLP